MMYREWLPEAEKVIPPWCHQAYLGGERMDGWVLLDGDNIHIHCTTYDDIPPPWVEHPHHARLPIPYYIMSSNR
jgi:hypothetical protein